MKRKSKQQRQQWWRGLTNNQRSEYIEKIVSQKAIRRKNKSLQLMKKYGDKFKCSECFHGQGGHCTDRLPNGCEYWFNPNSRKVGLKNRDKRFDKEKWLKLIKRKNPWLKVA